MPVLVQKRRLKLLNQSPDSSKNSNKQTGFIADHEMSSGAASGSQTTKKFVVNKSLDVHKRSSTIGSGPQDHDFNGKINRQLGDDINKSLAIS